MTITETPAVVLPTVVLERGALADGVPAGPHARRLADPQRTAAGVGVAIDSDAAQRRLLNHPLIVAARRAEWLADPDEDDGDSFSIDLPDLDY